MSYYPRLEHETDDPKGLAMRSAKGQLRSLKRELENKIEMWQNDPKEHLKEIEDAQETITKIDMELADFPEESKELVHKRIGLRKTNEKFRKPLDEQLQQDLSTQREDEEQEGVEDQSAILDDIRTELRKLSHQLDVIVHLIQLDRIYKTPDKRRQAQKLLMRQVRAKERGE